MKFHLCKGLPEARLEGCNDLDYLMRKSEYTIEYIGLKLESFERGKAACIYFTREVFSSFILLFFFEIVWSIASNQVYFITEKGERI